MKNIFSSTCHPSWHDLLWPLGADSTDLSFTKEEGLGWVGGSLVFFWVHGLAFRGYIYIYI
jgi:hypothetical protein